MSSETNEQPKTSKQQPQAIQIQISTSQQQPQPQPQSKQQSQIQFNKPTQDQKQKNKQQEISDENQQQKEGEIFYSIQTVQPVDRDSWQIGQMEMQVGGKGLSTLVRQSVEKKVTQKQPIQAFVDKPTEAKKQQPQSNKLQENKPTEHKDKPEEIKSIQIRLSPQKYQPPVSLGQTAHFAIDSSPPLPVPVSDKQSLLSQQPSLISSPSIPSVIPSQQIPSSSPSVSALSPPSGISGPSSSPSTVASCQKSQKQLFLRQQILQQNYNAEQFILFLNAKLDIDSDIDRCSLEELQKVVTQFTNKKTQQQKQIEQYYYNEPKQKPTQIRQQSKIVSIPKPQSECLPVLIRTSPQIVQQQFTNSIKCIKVVDKHEKIRPNIKCQVNNPSRKYMGGVLGIGGTSFLCFDVWAYGFTKEPVLRRYSDFVWLRAVLGKFYPSYIIPPIPNKKASKRLPRQILKRMRILSYFLNDLVKNPVLFNNKYVQGFLTIKNQDKFEQLKQQGQKKKSYESFLSAQTLTGKVDLQLSNKTIKYKDGLLKFVPQVQHLYKQITRNSKKMKSLTTQKINLHFSMANQFAQLYDLSNKFNSFLKSESTEKLSQIYAVLNNMMVEWGNSLKKEIDEVEKNMCTFFKYVREEFMGYKELLEKTKLCEDTWIKDKEALDRQKQKIFLLKDPKKWDLTKKDLQNFPKSAIYNRPQAFKIMLPKQSVQVQSLKQNYAFYLSQLNIHGNQNFQKNIELFCQNFSQFSIRMKVSNQEIGAMWTEVAYKFSDPFKKPHIIQFMEMQKMEESEQPSSGLYED